MEIEEVGNNKYRRKGHQETIYAPNINTAKARFIKELEDEFIQEMHILERMLFHKGFKLAHDQARELQGIFEELRK